MEMQIAAKSGKIACSNCPLRSNSHFREFTAEELSFISSFKTGELTVNQGATLLMEGARSTHLYTILSGWAFRSKVLEDGRRQILNYALPGDLLGLQGSLLGEMQHTVEALTPLTVCVFDRKRLGEIWERFGSLAFDITWMSAREERILDEHLLSIGRRSASERAAYLLAYLQQRLDRLQNLTKADTALPLTQTHVADTLGLSLVHTNKTLRKLAQGGLIRWMDSRCEVLDIEGLCKVAGWSNVTPVSRPFL